MKKTLLMIALAALAAGPAFAQEGGEDNRPPAGPGWDREGGGPPPWAQMDKRASRDRPHGPMDEAMIEQMRADHKAIKQLGEAARAETDPAKKAERVAQLRAKLAEVADRMLANQEKRLAQAEERIAKLKEKIESGKANRDTLLDEQVQRILSGEKPRRPDRFKDFPHAKGGLPEGGPGDEDMPPPPPPLDDEDAPPPEE